MRIGIFGGTFDPVHMGHLIVAETCREQLQLDQVRFLLAKQSPLKQDIKPTEDKHRIGMLELAIGGHPNFELELHEINRGGISYTVDTLRELAAEQPDVEWFFLMGADSLADLHRWKEPEEICKLAWPIVVARGGVAEPDWEILARYVDAARMPEVRKLAVNMPRMEISSSDLRQRVSLQRSIRYRVPRGVEVYIQQNGLYPGVGVDN